MDYEMAKLRELTLKLNQRDVELRERQCFYRSLLKCLPCAVLTANPETGAVKYVNGAFVTVTGFPAEEVLGRTPPYPWWPKTHHRAYLKTLSQGMEIGLSARDGLFITRDGDDLWVELTSMLVKPEVAEPYYLSTSRDITRQHVAEEQLRCVPDTVLIVEDTSSDSEVLRDVLTVAGYIVSVATTLQESVPVAAEHPAAAIVDLKLQEGNGLQIGRAIRQLSPGTRLIMLTGHPDQRTTAEAFRIGFIDYLVKPYDIIRLLEILHGGQ